MRPTILLALCTLAFGCKKKEQPEMNATPGQPGAMGPGGDIGSAMTGKDMGAAKTPDQIATRYQECWGFYNAGNFDELKTCLAPDVVISMPGAGTPEKKGVDAVIADSREQHGHGDVQLVLVSGKNLVGVVRLGDATVAQAIVVDSAGRVATEADYTGTDQPPKAIVLATGDAKEQANLAAVPNATFAAGDYVVARTSGLSISRLDAGKVAQTWQFK
jgi:hypothetical protein